jgi:methylmalonyl-CoA mutase
MDSSKNIRIVTATSLFDGHDAAINIMRRIMQSKGVEVIHLGHNRSVHEIVECAIEEDAHAIAVTSYQGGHVEFFKYMKDLLQENGAGHIKIFGGGGGTILPDEIEWLQHYGINRIYSPDDGRHMGLEGMIEDLIQRCSSPLIPDGVTAAIHSENGHPRNFVLGEWRDIFTVSRAITLAENGLDYKSFSGSLYKPDKQSSSSPVTVLGITGTGGAGKSSVTDEIVRRFLNHFHDKTIAVISVDPSKKKTGGALLGDRIRMNSIHDPRAYMRSLATRESDRALSAYVREAIELCKAAGYDFVILESAGSGQSDASILDYCDLSLYVMTPEYGAPSQLEKINMLDYANFIAINKFDKPGALDALHDVRKQYKRNHKLFNAKDDELPVIGTVASQFNDSGINELFKLIVYKLQPEYHSYLLNDNLSVIKQNIQPTSHIIHSSRIRYLSEIADVIREYDLLVKSQSVIASKLYQLHGAVEILKETADNDAAEAIAQLVVQIGFYENQLNQVSRKIIHNWPNKLRAYEEDYYQYTVRDKVVRQEMFTESLSGTRIPKVVLPKFRDWGDILQWRAQENAPGLFPFTAGVFPLKREGEDPTRMFAGEGSPERTNRRFHYVSMDQPSHRLSTAFDSVTLYGEDPARRPDIYGKIGNSGVSIATVDDAKKLYCGFDLADPKTSVSMTINGPAPVLLAFFLNAAIDQQCEQWISQHEQWTEVMKKINSLNKAFPLPVYRALGADGNIDALPQVEKNSDGKPLGLGLLGVSGDQVLPPEIFEQIKAATLSQVRGTVQADILKEDQAQNTCIFSTEFALKLMGDVQEYFIRHAVRNFYSVSISGYHIAEAGANPITQLAFTLANGFTYVEYYLSRGMLIDEFAPNLSFFFSNGMDAEYSVIGRVARRIWAKAMKYKYKANKRSQMLKYHIQTSGRSLHAQEIDFNDIRTTLQALYAIYDNCNSLHTNAYDEAITTPTEESVRRAMAIQLIINRELGSAKTENFIQGSFIIEELTNLVEDAVLKEFDRLTERGSVLGAMERMYQRNKIQEESLHYESLKHSGELPVVGVNTFLNKKGSPTIIPDHVIRSTEEEKEHQIQNLKAFHQRNEKQAIDKLKKLKLVAIENGNLFEELMETVKYCSLGQITHALYKVGGQYRRNM